MVLSAKTLLRFWVGLLVQIQQMSVLPMVLTYKNLYSYDGENQLVRENVYYNSNYSSESSRTVTYKYDKWGNMTEKLIYAYTTGAVAKPGDTASSSQSFPQKAYYYVYGNTQWCDKLTAIKEYDVSASLGLKSNEVVKAV